MFESGVVFLFVVLVGSCRLVDIYDIGRNRVCAGWQKNKNLWGSLFSPKYEDTRSLYNTRHPTTLCVPSGP